MDGYRTLDDPIGCDTSRPADQLVAAIASGASALVISAAGTGPLLVALGRLLEGRHTRILHVRPPLDLPNFVAQVLASDVAAGGTGGGEGVHFLSTTNNDRLALLVEDAHLLAHETIRYIASALRAEAYLQVVFAGRRQIADTLALDDFAGLRRYLSLEITLPGVQRANASVPAPPFPAPDAGASRSLPQVLPKVSVVRPHRRQRSMPIYLLAGAAVAAGLALILWLPSRAPVSTAVVAVFDQTPAQPATAMAPVLAQTASNPVSIASTEPPEPVVGPGPAMAVPLDIAPELPPDPPSTGGSAELPAPPPYSKPVVTIRSASRRGVEPPPPPVPVIAAEPTPSVMAEPELPAVRPSPAPSVEASLVPPVNMLALPQQPRTSSRVLPVHTDQVTTRSPASAQDDPRCRGIILRLQVGDLPTDGDRTFLRNGCR